MSNKGPRTLSHNEEELWFKKRKARSKINRKIARKARKRNR